MSLFRYIESRPAELGRPSRKGGRKCKPKRIRIAAVVLQGGKQHHLFSVMTTASECEVMKLLQAIRDR